MNFFGKCGKNTKLNKNYNMKIKITEFADRHFDPKFGGTKILDITREEFEKNITNIDPITKGKYGSYWDELSCQHENIQVTDGYAPFCKLVAIKNFTDARVGSMPITESNYLFLRSGYSARRDSELPVFSRWLELPLGKPKAEWLVLVLYSKEQIDSESKSDSIKELKNIWVTDYDKEKYIYPIFEDWLKKQKIPIEYEKFDADWGVVAILGQSHPNEEPMKPETMLRNALGKEEGGSGVALDRDAYMKAVDFWSNNATLK